MNRRDAEQIAAQGRLRYEPIGAKVSDGGVFVIDGVIVTSDDDHATCAAVLGLSPVPPSLVPDRLKPAPTESEPKRGNGRRRSKED